MPDDPFTEVLKKLWDLLEAQSEVTDIVAVGNRVKYWEGNLKPAQDRDRLSTTDLPRIVIDPAGGSFNPYATSTDAKAVQVYRIHWLDGKLLLHRSYFPLKWALCKALASADSLLSLSYVRHIRVEDGADEKNTEHPGWMGGIDILVEMWWSRASLKA